MASLYDFSRTIAEFNKEKKFADALNYFKEFKVNFTPEQIGSNKYLVNGMIAALIETNHFDVIFTFIEQYNVVLDIKNYTYLLKKFKDKASVNWNVVIRFCDLVSVDSLDTECRTIEVERKGIMKPMEFASNKEDWFAIKTKALFETQRYQECFELSKLALETLEKFHYSNDIWFARRIALSKKYLGNSEEALNELIVILRRKKDWFIQFEVAQIYKENGDFDKAFRFANNAINNFGDLEYKIVLIVFIAELLELKEEKELSFKHYSLSKLLRIQEGWNIPNSLSLALSRYDFEAITIEKLPKLITELKLYWGSFNQREIVVKQNSTQIQIGTIQKILHNDENGSDGFIKYNGNKSIYFLLNSTDDVVKKLRVGLEVVFKILPAIDGKREKAIQLRLKK